MSSVTARLKQRFVAHPLVEILQEFSWRKYFRIATARETTPLRKPVRSSVSYRFRARSCDEEHRQFKLLDSKVEEYTKIERGFLPAFAKLPTQDVEVNAMQFGFLGVGSFLAYILTYWFIREPLKRLYYKLDKHRIDFERTAEMEELLEEEAQVREMVGENTSTAQTTPDYVHSNLTPRQVILEKSFTSTQWKLEQAGKLSKKELRKVQDTDQD